MMNKIPANNPIWLIKKIDEMGGALTFYEFMDIVLNDPKNGYYGSGKANVGINGDFVTSPSLSDDFSYLLSIQIEKLTAEFCIKFTLISYLERTEKIQLKCSSTIKDKLISEIEIRT